MLLKYWKVNKELLMDLCMIAVMYAQDIDAGLLYAVRRTVLTTSYGNFESTNTLSRIALQK